MAVTQKQAILVTVPVVGLVFAAAALTLTAEPPPAPPPPPPVVVTEAPKPEPKPKVTQASDQHLEAVDPGDPRALTVRYPEADAREGLVGLLYDAKRTTRVHAVRGLGRWDDCAPEMFERLKVEPDRTVKALILQALDRVGTQDQIEPLNAYAEKEKDSGSKALARRAVESIYKRAGITSPKEQERLNAAWRAESDRLRAEQERKLAQEAKNPDRVATQGTLTERQRRRAERRGGTGR